MTTPKTSFTFKLTQPQQDALTGILRDGNYLPLKVEHTKIAAKTRDCMVALYNSGKCLVQGKGAAEFVTFILEPLVLQTAALGYEEVHTPEVFEPHMGVDESGKGDFFGPMVIAAAYTDRTLVEAMQQMGVKDSKQITSDDKAMAMGRELRRMLGNRFAIVRIGPQTYNRLYARMRNVNTLLSWAHARAIENLLDSVPDCPRAISDKFGNEKQLLKALMKKGRAITLEQRTKAESDPAVAAASILAREAFLLALKDLRQKYDQPFPKGASAAVREWAVELVKKNGPQVLLDTVKCHFRTTDQVLEAAHLTRSVLGPDGQAVSRAKSPEFFKRHKS